MTLQSSLRLSLLAATIAAVSVPALAAEEAKSEFKLYGQLHLSVDYLDYTRTALDADGDAVSESNLAVSSNSSRIGIKGEHGLNDDWKFTYVMEWQVGATEETKGSGSNTSSNNLARRVQWGGLKTDWAEFRVGRQDTPLKNIRGKVDMFYSDQIGENRTITNANGFDSRPDNAIQADFGAGSLHALLFYSADRGSDAIDDNDNDTISAALNWEQGIWYVGGGVEQRSYIDAAGGSDATKEDTVALRLAGSVKFGDEGAHKLGLFAESVVDASGDDGRDRTIMGIGYSAKFGDNVFKLAYYEAGDYSDYDNSSGVAQDQDGTGGSQFSLGWDRLLGKSTMFYISLAGISNGDKGSFKVVGVGHDGEITTAPGESNFGISFGVRHTL